MKKGVSPVIATVMLIAITVVLAAIVFLWARTFIAEGAQKGGEPVSAACGDIDFRAAIVNNKVEVSNIGDVPIYGFVVKKKVGGSVTPEDELSGVNIGEATVLNSDVSGAESVLVVPILLAEEQNNGNRVTFSCADEKGKEIFVV